MKNKKIQLFIGVFVIILSLIIVFIYVSKDDGKKLEKHEKKGLDIVEKKYNNTDTEIEIISGSFLTNPNINLDNTPQDDDF